MTKKITKTNGHLPSVLKEKLKLLVVAAVFVTGGVQAADKHAQGSIDWLTGTWYDAATGGNPVTAPTAGDNVFTNGFAVAVSENATCDNLTYTAVAGQLILADGVKLTVRGQINCATAITSVVLKVVLPPFCFSCTSSCVVIEFAALPPAPTK